MAYKTINIAGIASDSIVDGPGIRVAIFTQGCPHHCEGCHNPSTHSFGIGKDTTVQEL
ncbi:MAG: 4Fe-4S cluster-binding domain-containing protein, partial [Oscillospiraceae bacterium]